MASRLISIARAILCFALNIIAVLFPLFSLAFAGTPGFVSLYGYIVFVSISTVLNFVAWWLSSEPRKSSLAQRMFVLLGFSALMGSLSLPTLWSTPYPYGWMAFTGACGMLCFVFWRWQRDLTQFLEIKPNPESWRTAKTVIYQYGIPFMPICVALVGIFIFAMSKFMQLTLPWLESASALFVIPYVIAILAAALTIVAGGIKITRKLCRFHFPDKPYIWCNHIGLNIAERAFIEWKAISNIDTHWQSGRGGRSAAGAEIFTSKSVENRPLIVPLQNAILGIEATIDQMRAMATENGVTLPEKASPNARPVKPLSERDRKRAYRKSPELRKMLLDRLESLHKSIAEVERELSEIPQKILQLEQNISENRESILMYSNKIREIRKKGTLTPEFENAIKNAAKSSEDSMIYYEKEISEIPIAREKLELRLSSLVADLAKHEDERQRYMP